jgi:hypothetical protein
MVRAFESREFAISKVPYHYPSVPPKYRHIVLIGHVLVPNSSPLPSMVSFDDISALVAKLDNYVRMEGSTSCRLQASIVALDPSLPQDEISPRGNDANYVLRALLLLAYYGLRISTSQG